jgi:F0F1-type ATP synthase assembly protein I
MVQSGCVNTWLGDIIYLIPTMMDMQNNCTPIFSATRKCKSNTINIYIADMQNYIYHSFLYIIIYKRMQSAKIIFQMTYL